MQPNTPTTDAPIDDELLPPAPFAPMFDMPSSTLVEQIEGQRQAPDFLDDWESQEEGWLSRLGRRLFGR
jgi:hypothetical protein